jgi:anti-sigma regulatory factor (Ser/Thr protein kinase)
MLNLELPPGAEAPARARRELEGLSRSLDPELLDALRLLISELVTNSVCHGSLDPSDRIRVLLAQRGDRLRVEVTDPGRGFQVGAAHVGESNGDRTAGWGLYLVEHIADRWGVVDDGATRVWFELRAP